MMTCAGPGVPAAWRPVEYLRGLVSVAIHFQCFQFTATKSNLKMPTRMRFVNFETSRNSIYVQDDRTERQFSTSSNNFWLPNLKSSKPYMGMLMTSKRSRSLKKHRFSEYRCRRCPRHRITAAGINGSRSCLANHQLVAGMKR